MKNSLSHNFIISSGHLAITLHIEGSDEFVRALVSHSFWREYIPSVQITPSASQEADHDWTIKEANNPNYSLADGSIEIPQDLIVPAIVIIDTQFERLRQSCGLFTLHGSVIGDEAGAIGFIGGVSGLGKTSISAYAARHGFSWLCDEKFVIDEEGVVRAGVAAILNDEKTRLSSGDVRPVGLTSARPLQLLCIPLITSENEAVVHVLDSRRAVWQLYDEMSRDIRQINGMLQGFTTPLPSFDTTAISRRRQKAVLKLADQIPVVYVRGSTEVVLEAVRRLTT